MIRKKNGHINHSANATKSGRTGGKIEFNYMPLSDNSTHSKDIINAMATQTIVGLIKTGIFTINQFETTLEFFIIAEQHNGFEFFIKVNGDTQRGVITPRDEANKILVAQGEKA